jgi:hypothetical protein
MPSPTALPTQPPIIVEPPDIGLAPGETKLLRLQSVLGSITLTILDPSLLEASVDQVERTITITGKTVGKTVLTVHDARGLTRDVPISVAYPAGSIAPTTTLRVTGNPATSYFIKEQALQAALRSAEVRSGGEIISNTDSITFAESLSIDNVTTVDVPMIIQGRGYLTVEGTTHVRVENVAQPPIHPAYLMVSDFPETLKENGLLFEADLSTAQAARFLYYHDNPAGQPTRHIVLHLENPSSQPANVQFTSGMAGPETNEMQVGHLSTERFLTRNANNEGAIITILPHTTATLVDQALPARNTVSNLLQIREIDGARLHLRLMAEVASTSVDTAASAGAPPMGLLTSAVRHARGIYKIPEFFFDYQYDTSGPNVEIPIGRIPVPELEQGEALAGDYGVLQSVTIRVVNPDPHNPAYVALYANPRGGRATGTFIIDGILVQTHALPSFSHIKLREYTVPPDGFIRTTIVTMPEGGSSYPVHLIAAPDDGSTSPGAPGSLAY